MTAEFFYPLDPVMLATDLCDRCPAQAWVGVLLSAESKSSLRFCAHHYRQHELKLIEVAAFIVDERFRMPQ